MRFPLFKRKQSPAQTYDRDRFTPVLRRSICTGETVAGFREKATGRFQEVMLVRSESDLAAFRAAYGITEELETIY